MGGSSDGELSDGAPSDGSPAGDALPPGGEDDAPPGGGGDAPPGDDYDYDYGGDAPPPADVPNDAPAQGSTKGVDVDGGGSSSTTGRRGLRARLVLGPGTGARGPEAEAVLQWTAEAAFAALSQSLSLRGRAPAGGKLLLPAECDVWGSDRRAREGREVWECVRWSVPATCAAEAPHDPALFSTAAPPPRSCPAGKGPSDPGCRPTAMAASGGAGADAGAGVDADLVVYLTVKQEPCGGGDLGQATACSWDFETGRTLAGVINICPSALEAVVRAAPPAGAEALGIADVATLAEFGSLVDTIVHEAGHLLGFSTQLYPRFRDAQGRPLPAPTLEEPGGRILLATPRVLEVARQHYGCDEIEGVPMEDGGGEGTRGSHWEVSWIGDRDVMLGTSFRPGRAVISPLTLALFEDTGWFDVDWDTAGAWGFGAGLGCAVLDPAAKCLDRRYFCDPTGAAGAEDAVQCTWDHMDVGRCYNSEMLPPGCGVVQPFANYLCGEPVESPQGLWGEARGPNSRCVEVAPEPKVWQARPTRFQTVSAPRGGGAGCYAMECRGGAVSLVLEGRAVPCPAGEFVDLGAVPGLDISRGSLGPCPSAEEVCPGLERADDCNGLGDSVDGECRCFLGFGGPSCSEMLASNDTVQGYSGRGSEDAPGGGYPSFKADAPSGGPDWLPQAILGALVFLALLSLSTAFCTLGERCCDGRRRARARREARPRRERGRAAGAPAGFDAAVDVQ